MDSASWLWRIIDWGSIPIVVLVAGILVWRKLYREFPFFFTYLLATECATLARLVAQFRGPWTSFYVYWISNLALDVFNLLAVYELFALRLFPRFHRLRPYRYIFTAGAAIILLGGWLTAMESADRYKALLVRERVFNFIIVGLLAFFISLMMVMGREWKRYDFAVAFGFVIANAGSLIASAMWLRTSYRFTTVQELAPLTYDLATLIWLYSFSSREKVFNPRAPASLHPDMVQEARRWETVLKEWIAPGKRSSRDLE